MEVVQPHSKLDEEMRSTFKPYNLTNAICVHVQMPPIHVYFLPKFEAKYKFVIKAMPCLKPSPRISSSSNIIVGAVVHAVEMTKFVLVSVPIGELK